MKCTPNETLDLSAIRKGLTITSFSEEETKELGKTLATLLPPKALLLFSGDLGAGKTTLIKGIGEALAIDPMLITSPTFSLLHIYQGKRMLYHFDLYRLKGKEEFLSLGFQELLNGEGLFCIEWPERLEGLTLEKEAFTVHIQSPHLKERLITIQSLIG